MAAAMKQMALSFAKLDKFEGMNFRRWQKKMHLFLSSMSVLYLLTNPIPKDGDNATVEQIGKEGQNVESFKELWDSLEAKYMAEDASSKKFLISNFTKYKMTDSRPVMEQYNELLGILGRVTQHKINMDEAIQVSCIIDKLPPSWKDFKHTLIHLKEELTLVELGSHLRIEESLKVQDSDKPKGKNVACPSVVNMKCGKTGHIKRDCKGVNVGNKTNGLGIKGSVDGSFNSLKGERGIECIFVRYAEHSKAFRFYVIEPNDSVLVNSIIESRDAIFDENRFSLVPRPSLRIPNEIEDIWWFSGTRDEISDQHSCCFNVDDDPKTSDKAMNSQDVAF
ncbi:zinc finger, CCHC-type containing protein [Tanacetum coccineum]